MPKPNISAESNTWGPKSKPTHTLHIEPQKKKQEEEEENALANAPFWSWKKGFWLRNTTQHRPPPPSSSRGIRFSLLSLLLGFSLRFHRFGFVFGYSFISFFCFFSSVKFVLNSRSDDFALFVFVLQNRSFLGLFFVLKLFLFDASFCVLFLSCNCYVDLWFL